MPVQSHDGYAVLNMDLRQQGLGAIEWRFRQDWYV